MGWSKGRVAAAGVLTGLILLGAFAALRESGSGNPLIIGDRDADEGECPFVASLHVTIGAGPGFDNHHCGGALIDVDGMLTAAHCVAEGNAGEELRRLPPNAFHVVIGRTRLRSSVGSVRRADAIHVHPDYKGTGSPPNEPAVGPDVALLHLSEPVENVVAASPVLKRELWEPKDKAVVVGWGSTDPDGNGTSDHLKEIQVDVMADDVMASAYGAEFTAVDMLGAGHLEPGRDSCRGDSGGPLLVDDGGTYAVAGIVSWGAATCAEAHKPGVYTRVGEGPARVYIEKVVGATARGKARSLTAS